MRIARRRGQRASGALRPEEVAELLAFLATPKAGYLTGVDILIDGGTLAGIKLHGAKVL